MKKEADEEELRIKNSAIRASAASVSFSSFNIEKVAKFILIWVSVLDEFAGMCSVWKFDSKYLRNSVLIAEHRFISCRISIRNLSLCLYTGKSDSLCIGQDE